MDFDTYYLRALRYLNIRPRSEKEIRDYLTRKLSPRVIPAKVGIHRNKISDPSTPLRFAQDDNIEQIIDLIVLKLKEQKFLNDEEFAKMWVRSRTEFKPKGERLIRLELQQKGIDKETINNAFQAFDAAQAENNEGERDELSLAKDILEKKKKKFEPMDKQERFTKAGSLLARRGFDLDTIKQALKELDW